MLGHDVRRAEADGRATIPAGDARHAAGGWRGMRPMPSRAPAPRPLLLVEDDEAFGAELAHQISASGFAVTRAATVAEAEARLVAPGTRHDALLVDVHLPDGDGRELCAQLRERGLRQPILMLTGEDDETAVLRGLALGANDWIRKPCRLPEVLARLRAQMRAFDDSVHAVFAVGSCEFHVGRRRLLGPDGCVRAWLTAKEAKLLAFLCRAGERVVTRQALLDEVWGTGAHVCAQTLDTNVYRLRCKLEPDPRRPRFLLRTRGGFLLARAETRSGAGGGLAMPDPGPGGRPR